jgi:hypothetical protein
VKLLYKPLGALVGMIATAVAVRVWRKLWHVVTQGNTPPRATNRDNSWTEIVLSSALRGAVIAVVRAVIKRSGATAYRNVTGTWPGKSSAEAEERRRDDRAQHASRA